MFDGASHRITHLSSCEYKGDVYLARHLGARANVASRPTSAAAPLVRRDAASGRKKW